MSMLSLLQRPYHRPRFLHGRLLSSPCTTTTRHLSQTCDKLWVEFHGTGGAGRGFQCIQHRQVKVGIRSLCRVAPARSYSYIRAASSSNRTTAIPLYKFRDTVITRSYSTTKTTTKSSSSEIPEPAMALKQGEFVGSLDCGTT